MNGMGGLFELIMAFAIVGGWGFIELRAARHDKKSKEVGAAGRPTDTDRLRARDGSIDPSPSRDSHLDRSS